MTWLLELLFDSLRTMLAQFVVDLMDTVTGVFTDLMCCDLSLFEDLFSVAGQLYQNAVMPFAVALLAMICVWQLFKTMFGRVGTSAEEPVELVGRSVLCLFCIVYSKRIVDYLLMLAGTPYQWIVGSHVEIGSFSGFVSAAEQAAAPLGLDKLSLQLLLLVMQLVVAWNYFKLLYVVAERYASGIREGILYPELPEPKNEEEKQVLGELQVCLEQKKEKELRVIRETLLYLHNILEDMYIEARQCAEYGGIVQKAIRFLGRWDMEQAESIRQMQEYGMDSLSIMKNVLLQYLRSKKVNDWERAGGIYMEMLERCKETLDEVVIPADEDVRFRAANRLLLILWEFVKEAFEQEESGKEDTEQIPPEYEGGDGAGKWKESAATDTKEGEEKRRRAAAVLGGEQQEKAAAEDSVKEISDEIGKIVTKMEQEMLERELKENADKMDLGEIHNGYRLRIIRPEPTLEQIARYEVMKKKVDAAAEKMVRLIAPHLEEQERFQKGMVQGKKVCGSQIYRRDGRIFRSRNIPGNQDAAVGVLIDESASMDIHNRIGSARYTACVIYRFCQRLGIPVLILGHSTGIGEKKESVELYSYAEFDAWDQKDCFRLTGIRSRWNNRDGAALAYAGMRLGKRAEGQKLLFVISDGLPLAEGYRGEAGIADTRREREKLEHRGIHVMAAAIGEDRELIRRIYGKGFLNISDTERIPAAMAGIIRQYMGK